MEVAGENMTVEPGDVVFIPEGVLHSLRNVHHATSVWLYGYDRRRATAGSLSPRAWPRVACASTGTAREPTHMLKLAAMFAAVFVGEMGDKTQLAVLIGGQGARYLEMVPLKLIAGVGFIAIGAWSLLEHFRG